jgi:hypothetical protein
MRFTFCFFCAGYIMKVTAKFAGADGNAIIATFDVVAGTVSTPDGRTGTFSRASNVLTIDSPDQKLVVTLKDAGLPMAPGLTTTYTTATGGSGTVTVLSVQ